MTYTVTELVTNAYYASKVVSRDFETLQGSQLNDGINWLNDILAEKTVDSGMIPYESTYSFNFIVGQESYYIPDLISIDTLVFFLQSVRYSMRYEQRNRYLGSTRVEGITSLPQEWYFEASFGGGTLFVYFFPDQAYPVTIRGRFRLSSVSLGQDISLTIDHFYITYLRTALAQRICTEYNFATPPNILTQLGKYEDWIKNKSRLVDLRMQKTSTLSGKSSLNWAQVNLGHGWTTP